MAVGAEVKCPQCGAPLSFDAGAILVRCTYCESQVFIDRRGATLAFVYPFLVGGDQARGVFRRWTAGSRMAKDLETTAQVRKFDPVYFPVYLFRRRFGPDEKVFLEPAKMTTLPGLHGLHVPPGDMKHLDADFDLGGVPLLPPEIGIDHYLTGMAGEPVEQSLVYMPFYQVAYDFGGASYSAVIEGSSGEVFATDYPPRKSAMYVLVGALGLLGAVGAWSLVLLLPQFWFLGLAAVIAAGVAITAAGNKVAKEY